MAKITAIAHEIAISKAIMPGASPGARIDLALRAPPDSQAGRTLRPR
jgi:hypothetical protein